LGEGGKGLRADIMPRAPQNVNPALASLFFVFTVRKLLAVTSYETFKTYSSYFFLVFYQVLRWLLALPGLVNCHMIVLRVDDTMVGLSNCIPGYGHGCCFVLWCLNI
jgi:hypothetical protein